MGYQVPMIEVSVTVAVDGAEPEEHFLYLAPYSDRRDGPESLADYLNGRRHFLPMVAAGVPKMINRGQICWVRCGKLPVVYDPAMTIVEKPAIVELSDGTRIEGLLPIDRPSEYSRISDVLNDTAEAFVRVDEEDETCFVNKLFIRSVIPR
jgi:hypothetical protein